MVNEEERVRIAFDVLKKMVNKFSKTFHDSSELESIGYEVIADNIKKEPKDNKNDNWEYFIYVCIRNKFYGYMKKCGKQNKLKEIAYKNNNDRIEYDYCSDIINEEIVNCYVNKLKGKQLSAVRYFLKHCCVPPDRSNFYMGIKNIRKMIKKEAEKKGATQRGEGER